ncbi:MAG TPA: hypothetical protein VKU41_12575 [Polyangiaceae bacterium]|nr:hypothetical protein [Polyangiaceae bacterium]
MRSYSFVVLLPCLLAAFAVDACSNQNEGEPCDPSASDCSNGLTCQTISGVSGPRCCPGDLQLANNPACSNQQAPLEASTEPPDSSGDGQSQGEAAAPVPEGSAPVEASSVTPAEAGPDGPSE